MKIAFWSPTPFAGRKSAHLLLFALQTVAAGGGEQLILHADAWGSGPEHFLLTGNQRSRMIKQKEFGVEYLARCLQCERFSKETVINASYTFAEGKLHVLPAGSTEFYKEKEEEVVKGIKRMIRQAHGVFENVWLELPAGRTGLSEELLSEADCVVVNLAQSPWEVAGIERLPQVKNAFYLIGAYEQGNIYTMHNLELLFPKLRGRCGAIPYDKSFFAACCKGEAEAFRKREESFKSTKTASWFLRGVESAYEKWKEGWSGELCGDEIRK